MRRLAKPPVGLEVLSVICSRSRPLAVLMMVMVLVLFNDIRKLI